jgi:hypothetical protein
MPKPSDRTQIEAEIARLQDEIGDVRRSQPLRTHEMQAARERRIAELREQLATLEAG